MGRQNNILITGSNGFVGRALLTYVKDNHPYSVQGAVRKASQQDSSLFSVGDIDATTDWSDALQEKDVVIHVAARAHIVNHSEADPIAEYRRVNVDGTLNLARQAVAARVKRFIFISSIGVNGGHQQTKPFLYSDSPSPWDDYTKSKCEAEIELWGLSSRTDMELVVIRPPLIYGANAPGNFGKLIHAIVNERWLPLGRIDNLRSFVAIDNLLDLIMTCIDHPKAANETFLVSDDRDVSTTQLLRMMAHAFGKKERLIPIPMSWIRGVASLLGKKTVADRLCGSLQVDITHTKETLGWRPPVTIEQQLAKIAASMSSPRDV
ncbi:NAD-dependent epimerase/dehydratase family protein [Aeromonas caviae]